jgi:hypothetical protein
MSFLLRHLKSSLKERLKASCEIHILEQVLRPPGSLSKRNPQAQRKWKILPQGFLYGRDFLADSGPVGG